MKCNACNGTRVKSRSNYSHGKKSKGTTQLQCKDCGSTDIAKPMNNRRRGRR